MSSTVKLNWFLCLWSRKSLTSKVAFVLWTDLTGDKSFPHKDLSTATSSRGTMNQFYDFDSQSLDLNVLHLWLSQQFFWVRYRIPPVSQPRGPKPLILRVCLSWVETHKALYREITHEICTGVLVVPSEACSQQWFPLRCLFKLNYFFNNSAHFLFLHYFVAHCVFSPTNPIFFFDFNAAHKTD